MEEKKRSRGSWKGRGGRTVGNAILRGRGAQKSLGLGLGRQQNPRRAGWGSRGQHPWPSVHPLLPSSTPRSQVRVVSMGTQYPPMSAAR